MPPKKQSKAEVKKKEKIADDKTFGMKNKKGKKQQEQIQRIQQQVKGNNVELNKAKEAKKKEKEEKAARELEMNLLFRPTQKVGAGADPKSILCSFFVQGTCQKGAKCKFSHDMSLANKSEKKSLYETEEKKEEGMDEWDQTKLEEVIAEKHGKENKRQTSDQICKHFLKAVEKSIYGWFWTCPNGDKCLYKHALPPGFILKKDIKNEAGKKEEISLEELIDIERKRLGPNTTKVTLETFTAWKNKKLTEKKEALIQSTKKKKKDFKQGRLLGFSGREMFAYKPEMVVDDEDAEDELEREVEEDAYEGEIHEVEEAKIDIGEVDDEEEDDEQPGPAQPGPAQPASDPVSVDNVAIDESLFDEQGLEDLDLDDSDDDD